MRIFLKLFSAIFLHEKMEKQFAKLVQLFFREQNSCIFLQRECEKNEKYSAKNQNFREI